MTGNKKISEGEKFLAIFFEKNDIPFKREVEINDLKGDSKSIVLLTFI